jgi:hypothetical protein
MKVNRIAFQCDAMLVRCMSFRVLARGLQGSRVSPQLSSRMEIAWGWLELEHGESART